MIARVALFERAVRVAIVANTAVLVASFVDDTHEQLWEPVHTGFLMFFAVEIAVRFAGAGYSARRFLSDRWNCIDAAVVGLSLLPVLGVGVTLLRVARLARVVHTLRHASGLRVFDIVRRRNRKLGEAPT